MLTRDDESHLSILSVLYYVYAAFSAVGIVALLVHMAAIIAFLFLGAAVTGTIAAEGDSDAQATAVGFGALFMAVPALMLVLDVVILVFIILHSIGLVIAARNLAARRGHGFCMLMAIVSCLNIPLGTALGIFTFFVLTRDSVKQAFAANDGSHPQPVPAAGAAWGQTYTPQKPAAQSYASPAANYTGTVSTAAAQPGAPADQSGGNILMILGVGVLVAVPVLILLAGLLLFILPNSGNTDVAADTSADTYAVAVEPESDASDGSSVIDSTANGSAPISFAAQQLAAIDSNIALLNSKDPYERKKAAEYFVNTPVDNRRQRAVAGALEDAINSDQDIVNEPAMEAMLEWGDQQNSLAVAQSLKRGLNRSAALKFLRENPNPEVAETVAGYLGTGANGRLAVEVLEKIGPSAEEVVRRQLNSSNPHAVEQAQSLLKQYGVEVSDLVIDLRLRQLQSSDEFEAVAAAEWLAENELIPQRQSEVSQMLEFVLTSENERVREAAVRAAVVWADERAAPALLGFLRRGDGSAASVIRALGRMKYLPAAKEFIARLDASDPSGDAATDALVSLGPESAPLVLPNLHHKSARIRDRAKSILAAIGTGQDQLVQQTIADLKRPQSISQISALEFLATARLSEDQQNEVAPLLTPLVSNSDASIAKASFALLLDMEDESFYAWLGDALKDNGKYAQNAKLLGELGGRGEAAGLKLLQSDEPKTAIAACRLLADIGTRRSLQPLKQRAMTATNNGQQQIVTAAGAAYSRIQARE